jgi:uncharacterized metal-binding protein YceD (DUF177 family)
MKVHINQIPPEGLHVEGEESSRMLDLHEEAVRPVSEVRYALDVGLSDGGLFATGRVGVDLDLQCVSCLERFRYALEVPEFACQVELTGAESVDLTEPVREDILLALPPNPHCDWNGERVCQGAQLRAQATADSLTETDEAENTRRVWGALDQLKINKT